jgi:hypothetical protein
MEELFVSSLSFSYTLPKPIKDPIGAFVKSAALIASLQTVQWKISI